MSEEDASRNKTTPSDGGFVQQATPYIANGEHLTRAWLGGWTATTLDVSQRSCDDGDDGAVDREFLPGEGPMIGELYEIDRNPLGTGSFGLCYPSVRVNTQQHCCMKIIDKVQVGDEYRMNLVEDGMFGVLLNKTRHPGIVQYYDFIETPLYYFEVMELLNGPDLFDQFIEDYPVTEDYVQKIMTQILSALEQLESDGLVHRDVKLENFRYAEAGTSSDLKLLDFGFARRINSKWEDKISGTLMYLSPEIVADAVLDDHPGFGAAADVWAAGVVLCMLLTGREPFTESEVWNLPRPDGASIRERLLSSNRFQQTSVEAKCLLGELLTIDPKERITAKSALKSPWFDTSASQSLGVPRENFIKVKMISRASQKFINASSLVAKSLSRNRMPGSYNSFYPGSSVEFKAAQNRKERVASLGSLSGSDDDLFCFDGS